MYSLKSIAKIKALTDKGSARMEDLDKICNIDLIKGIIELMQDRVIEMNWVKGHYNILGNEKADCYAKQAYLKLLIKDQNNLDMTNHEQCKMDNKIPYSDDEEDIDVDEIT